MRVELLSHTPDPALVIVESASKCYKTEVRDLEHAYAIIDNLIRSGHESVLEHVSFTFDISGVSRALSHQLVRHRIASYTQVSQRYVEGMSGYVIPSTVQRENKALYLSTMRRINNVYNTLLENGVPAEDARYIFPNAVHTELTCTMNVRSLRNFFKERLCKRAQWEIRELAMQMYDEVNKIEPALFRDVMRCHQCGKCKEGAENE